MRPREHYEAAERLLCEWEKTAAQFDRVGLPGPDRAFWSRRLTDLVRAADVHVRLAELHPSLCPERMSDD